MDSLILAKIKKHIFLKYMFQFSATDVAPIYLTGHLAEKPSTKDY